MSSRGKNSRGKTNRRTKSALVTKQQVRDMISSAIKTGELKYFSSFLLGSSVVTLAFTAFCSDIPQGISDTQRIGDEILITRFRYSIDFVLGVTSATLRLIIIQWMGEITAAGIPAASEVLFNATAPGNLTSVYNQDSLDGGLLRVLVDRTMLVPITHTDRAHAEGEFHTGFAPRMQFSAGTTTGEGKFFAYVWTDATSAVSLTSVSFATFYRDM